ncbi:hypothetical protein FRC08_014786 [Ceratobasidium sp. 394]|nr:hypothetical protein FRC08_014786 [Ceratobasidium sp. 394]
MTSTVPKLPEPKIFKSLSEKQGLTLGSRVIDGLAARGKMIVICGGGISVSCGIPGPVTLIFTQDFRSKDGLWNKVVVPAGPGQRQVKGSALFGFYHGLDDKNSGFLNRLMTEFRITARQAPLSTFHRFLHRAMSDNRISMCFTRNFDGMETRDRPDLADRVYMLHGDNRNLCCPNAGCPDIHGDDTRRYDEEYLSLQQPLCPSCSTQRAAEVANGSRPRTIPQQLTHCTILDGRLDPDFCLDYMHTRLMHDVDDCDTLLIVGTTLRNDIGQLVKDIASKVHDNEGAVVYIDKADTSTKSLAACRQHIDYHLMMDAQECAQAILNAMDSNEPEVASEVWVELSEKMLETGTTIIYPFLDIPYCCQCHFPEPDHLVKCVACGLHYCFEAPGAILRGLCLTLDVFGPDGFSTPMQDFHTSFRCFECYDHSSALYPHHVRGIPEFYEQPVIRPGLICLVYYLAQFWPLAQHIVGNVTGAWQMKRWQSTCVPVRLQSLEPTTVIDAPG